MNWVPVLGRIPRKDFILKFSRSSGPGGQNVNKVNSKATIRLEHDKLAAALWLDPSVRQKLLQRDFTYSTSKGDLVVSSELTRSQHLNIEDCFEKLSKAIAKTAFVPSEPSAEAQKRWKGLSQREKAYSKETKKRHSAKKKDRGVKYID